MNLMEPNRWPVVGDFCRDEKASFEPLLDEDDVSQQSDIPLQHQRRSGFMFANIIFFLASLCCLLGSGVLYMKSHSDVNLLRQKSFYSPVANKFSPSWRPDTYVTHPLDSPDSIFRQDPSDAVDAAWERVHKIGVLPISSDDVRGLGKDPSIVVQPPESWNLGPDTHIAHLDGLHLIHCLNAMRKSLHQNFDHYYPDSTPEDHHAHLSHCQEALAKHLMCQPSLEMITYSWSEGRSRPFPDFDITRKCYDLEQLLEWQEEHEVKNMSQDKWDELVRPEGSGAIPLPILLVESWNETKDRSEDLFKGPE